MEGIRKEIPQSVQSTLTPLILPNQHRIDDRSQTQLDKSEHPEIQHEMQHPQLPRLTGGRFANPPGGACNRNCQDSDANCCNSHTNVFSIICVLQKRGLSPVISELINNTQIFTDLFKRISCFIHMFFCMCRRNLCANTRLSLCNYRIKETDNINTLFQ